MGTKVAASETENLTSGGGVLMMADPAHRVVLERRAADKIESGELPVPGNRVTRAGAASGMACDLCAEEIEKSKIEYEVEWRKGETVRMLRFHLQCFQAWISSRPQPD
jgi:hypothetical protein